MSLKTLIEGFDRKYSAEQPKVVEKYSLEEASKAMTDLAKALFSTLRRLENNYESNIKAYEIAFQDAIEGQFPGKSWWEVTNCNIFDSLFRGRDPELTVTEILKGVKPEYKEEKIREARTRFAKESDDIGNAEYKIGLARHIREIPKYSDEQLLKDYRDFKGSTHKDDRDVENAIKHEMEKRGLTDKTQDMYDESLTEDLSYGEIVAIEQEWNKFKKKTGRSDADAAWEFIETECKGVYDSEEEKDHVFALIGTLEEMDESFKGGKQKLTEGTSNFWTMDKFPLLVFEDYDVAYDDIYDITASELGDDFEGDVVETPEFEQNFGKYYDYCLLDESEVEELKRIIKEFNWEMNRDEKHDPYEEADVSIVVKPGYYQAAQIFVEDEEHLSDWQVEEIDKFLKEIKREFGLTELGVSWRASNGETGYHKIDESLNSDKSLDEARGNYGHKPPFWYFTLHGVQPGTIPSDVKVLEIRDGVNRKGTQGTFVALDGVLTGDELRRYDLIELAPENPSLKESKRIDERKWSYTLRNGANLRDAIDAEDYYGIIESLKKCYQELLDAEIIDEDDYETYVEDFEYIDVDDEDAEEEIDFQLGEFYDLCDNLGVWVSMNESVEDSEKTDKHVIKIKDINKNVEWEKEDDSEVGDPSHPIQIGLRGRVNKLESVGDQVSEYQKWVDYDMKKYHRISDVTMRKIKEAGLSVVKDQYDNYEVIADRPIKEAYEQKYVFEFEDGAEIPATSEDEAVRIYKRLMKGRQAHAARKFSELDDIANDLYEKRDVEGFCDFTNKELAILWAHCLVTQHNPYGQPYDDEVYDTISMLPNREAIFKNAKLMVNAGLSEDVNEVEYQKKYYAQRKPDGTGEVEYFEVEEPVHVRDWHLGGRNRKSITKDEYNQKAFGIRESAEDDKLVVYKCLGKYCVTPKWNYKSRIQDARKIKHLDDFESAEEIKQYYNKYFHTTDDDFEVIDEAVDPKAFYQMIIDTNGNPSIEDFKSVGYSEPMAVELISRMADYDADTYVRTAKRLLNKNESLKEAMLFKPMTRDEAKDFYNRIKSSEMDAKFKKIVLDDLNFFTDNFEKDYGKREVKESVKKPQHKISEDVGDEMQVYMNTWANYNEYGADLSQYGIKDGWMSIDDALDFCEEHAEDEPFINDTDNIPSAFEIDEYSNAAQTLEELKQFEESGADIDIVEAIMMSGYSSIKDALDKYEDGDYYWYPGVTDSTDLAYAVIDEIGSLGDALGDRVNNYIDEDAMRRDYEYDVRDMMYDDAKSEVAREEDIDEDEVTDEQIEDWIDDNIDSYLDSIIDEEIALAEQGEIDLSNYFDYERFGRDLSFDGYVFTDAGAILVL